MKELPENIREVFIKQLREEAHPEYHQLLEEWQRLYPEYAHEFSDIIKIWKESGQILRKPDFETSKAWAVLDRRLTNTMPVKGHLPGRTRFIKVIIAAAIITGLVLTGWWMQHNRNTASQLVSATTSNRYLTLPDGTTVWLRKGATIKFPLAFKQKERKVLLTGEAFFDVKQAATSPFRIQTERSVVEVLGTSFLINAAEASDRVVVVTGKVLFAGKRNPEERLILTARQEAVFTGETFHEKSAADSGYQFWQKDTLLFSKTPLDQVAGDLTAYYRIPVTIADTLTKSAHGITITASFQAQSLEQVLHEITIITGLRYRRQQDTIIFY